MVGIVVELEAVSHVYRSYRRTGAGLPALIKDLINRQYLSISALKDINLTIGSGERVGILGANGAGKTTLTKLMCGIIRPTEGRVRVLGEIPSLREGRFLRRIGVILGQKSQLEWDLPAVETFRVLRAMYRVPVEEYTRKLEELTDLFELESTLYVPVRLLSLGQRMKFEVVASLLHSPKVLLLDEPSIGLDVVSQRSLRDMLLHQCREYGTTLLISSHNMKDIERLAERVLCVHQGRIVFDGSPGQLSREFGDRVIIRFLTEQESEHISRLGAVREGGEYVMSVPASSAPIALELLLSNVPVDELSVEKPDMEEIAVKMFERFGNERKPVA